MAIFRQVFVIESSVPVQEAWKNLLPIVKTDSQLCGACGQILAAGIHFCSHCGQRATSPEPQTWVQGLFSRSGYQFEGDVSPQEFNISRIVSRNCCIPVIRGRFEPSATGTRIVIEMNMHPLGYVFLVGGMAISFIVPSVLAADSQGISATAIAAFAVPCLIGLVCWVAFTAEANTARVALSLLWPPAAQL